MTKPDADSGRVLILMPIGRDGPTSLDLLRRIGLAGHICTDLGAVVAGIQAGAATVLIAEEGLFGQDLAGLTHWVAQQAPWSDLPFIVLTSHHEHPEVAAWRQRLVPALRNVTMIERPMQAITLTSSVQAAVRARLRQYEVRTLLEAQARAAQQLEALVKARTHELEEANAALRQQMAERAQIEEALRQAQKMDAIGNLSGGIAHDFNNLLQGVAGSLDLIRRRPNDHQRVRRWAEAGLQAAERGARLTAQLLSFSRAQRVEAKPVIVAELLDGIRDLLSRTLGPMIRVTMELDSDRMPVLSDPTQLEMAVLNLAINARDAMPGGGDLHLSSRVRRILHDPELQPGEYVELSVTDTGEGMPADVVSRAFDPFYTTKAIGKGTGLGLSQVYGIARQAGGTARIESRPGQGTTVRMLLRRTELPLAADAATTPPDADTGTRAATVLVVDDDADVRRFMADALDTLGYHTLEAENGEAGLQMIDGAIPQLVVVDFAMPGMNGAEFARSVWARHPDMPIVFASGYAETAAIEEVAGPNSLVLRKPFRITELQGIATEALRSRVRA
ncbi:MAG TPA: ATP-binding protein [Acetobacteraceae bacterium]|nr:ATP-binding protein [Acetobacteraceae bacterium]